MLEYTPEELSDLFLKAIALMASDGVISPAQYRDYVKNINKWLNQELRD
jgi:hypothetical protein